MRVPSLRAPSGRIVRAAAAGLLVLAVTAPANAASGGKVEIVVQAGPVSPEPFTATGAFCPGGGAISSDFRFAGGGRAGTFHLIKTLTCTDGTGTLVIRVDAATANGSPQDQGGWSVVSGSGDYATARGGGNLVGYYGDGSIEDHYTGVLGW